jgi:hypothetical protein
MITIAMSTKLWDVVSMFGYWDVFYGFITQVIRLG